MLTKDNNDRGLVVMLVILLWSLLAMAVDIAAVVIAFTEDVKGCHSIGRITPRLFLLIGGFTNIGATVLMTLMVCCLSTVGRNVGGILAMGPFGFLVFLTGLFTIAWSIIGLIMYSDFSTYCQDTHMGKMILSWSIIKLVFAIFHGLSHRATTIVMT
jgi:hypothetical protein